MSQNVQELFSIDFGKLIGGPLRAIIEGEAQAAQATADFIREVGFEEVGDHLELRNFRFSYPDVDGSGKPYQRMVQMPLLGLMPLPGIQVKRAEIDFSVNINYFERIEETVGGKPTTQYKLLTSVARSQSTTQGAYQMRVRLEVGQSDLTEGQARMLNLIQGAVQLGAEGGPA